ncbi:hypothetical protein TrVE_jg4973 [Triparma verrucosa]|uniref:Uncharacterized protein n=1 Tax=Triparma verrucosa TaxID=1606542 RepID=A0A9W7KWF6_9STRA|nr:hypothetical protein TrVE_jg4973 [Triparma verrucosa]
MQHSIIPHTTNQHVHIHNTIISTKLQSKPSPLKPFLTLLGITPSLNTSITYGFLPLPVSSSSKSMTMLDVEKNMVNIPPDERLRRLKLSKVLLPSFLLGV